MTRDEVLERMAHAVHAHCSMEDELLIAEMFMTHTARIVAMLMTRVGESFTDEAFARFCLQCAKRVRAGGTA